MAFDGFMEGIGVGTKESLKLDSTQPRWLFHPTEMGVIKTRLYGTR